jgi:hypothetical protein
VGERPNWSQKLARSPGLVNDGKNRHVQGRSAKNWKRVDASVSRSASVLYHYDYCCLFFSFLFFLLNFFMSGLSWEREVCSD